MGAILMPGGLRLRSLHPLIDRDGACPLLYDVERSLLIEVPMEFQFHLAYALEKGDLDETLLGWLGSEDLLTYEWSPPVRETDPGSRPGLSELPFERWDSQGFGCVYLLDDEVHCRIGMGSGERALETLQLLTRRTDGSARVTLHLESSDGSLDLPLLRRLVAEAERQMEVSATDLSYELVVEARAVDEACAHFLAEHGFRVRVRCDGPPQLHENAPRREGPWLYTGQTQQGVRRLLDHLGASLTVHAVLESDARLAYVWDWARELGVARLHVTQTALTDGDPAARETQMREFRSDLAAIGDEMFYTLEAGQTPMFYEPMIRVVRRLAGHRRRPAAGSGAAYLGVVSHGEVYPFYRHGAAAPEPMTPDTGEIISSAPCGPCWARHLCGRGCFADPCLTPEERLGGVPSSCHLWRAEVAEGLRLFHRLSEADPDFFLGLARETPDDLEEMGDPFDTVYGGLNTFKPF